LRRKAGDPAVTPDVAVLSCVPPSVDHGVETSHAQLVSRGEFEAVGPGGVFVVEGAVSEAAGENADEAVGEGSEGAVVGVAGALRVL
jgi:hypothetical protein